MRILSVLCVLAWACTAAQAQSPTNTLTMGGGIESSPVDRSDSYKGNLVWQHSLGGAYSIGTTAETYQIQGGRGHNAVRTSLEADAWYARQVWGPVGIRLGVGIGERVQTPHNFGYYALYATGNYTINDTWTLNAVQYRYRNGFDSMDRFESHQWGTGLTYNINSTNAVSAKVYRTYDGGYKTQADGGALFYTVRF